MVARNVDTYEEYWALTQGTSKKKREKYWPTPNASDNRDRGNLSNPAIQRRMEIGKQVNLSMCVSPVSGQLNPTWVEWLMGWPLGWTDLKPLETDKFQKWLDAHGKS
jgi:DNA (cytosine-5)-methyltransferase 1